MIRIRTRACVCTRVSIRIGIRISTHTRVGEVVTVIAAIAEA